MSALDDTLESMQVTDIVNQGRIETVAEKYISSLVSNLQEQFSHVHLIRCLGTLILVMPPCFQC